VCVWDPVPARGKHFELFFHLYYYHVEFDEEVIGSGRERYCRVWGSSFGDVTNDGDDRTDGKGGVGGDERMTNNLFSTPSTSFPV
jgi:hypothetical protein